MTASPLHVESLGREGDPPLVMVHGFGAYNHFWRHWATKLGQDHRVHMVEMMGFGRASTPPEGDYSPRAQAGHIADLLGTLPGGRPVLVGHSLGGAVALLTALEMLDAERAETEGSPSSAVVTGARTPARPAGLRALVVISAPIFPQKLPPYLSLARIPGVGELLLLLPPPLWALRIGIRGIVHDPACVNRELVEGYSRPLRSRRRRKAIIRAARQLRPEEAGEASRRFAEIELPTLAMWGAADPVVPPEFATRLEEVMPDARATLLSGVGHLPPEEAPERSLTLVREFLASLPAE